MPNAVKVAFISVLSAVLPFSLIDIDIRAFIISGRFGETARDCERVRVLARFLCSKALSDHVLPKRSEKDKANHKAKHQV